MIVKAKKDRELILIRAQNTQNENKAETIEIEVPEEYESYNKKIVFITTDGTVWDIITNNEYKITNAITKYKQVDFYIWLTKEVNGESIDFRSKTKTLRFYDNIDASDEITPEEIHGVNTVVNLLEEEIEKVENLNIEATKIGDTTTITITKKDGTTESVEINDGTDGQDGQDGKDAKINGKNSIEIEAGNNITIDDTENGIRINSTGGGSGGTSNYNDLSNKPKINNVELSGNKSLNDLGIQPKGNYLISETDPTVPSYVKNITQANITNWNNKADISDIPDVSNFITRNVNNLVNYTLKTNTGSLIDLEINQTTYVVTLSLKNQDGNVISTDTIDLPLENVVVSGSYDSTNQKIVLTLQSGDTIDIPVGALVSGLQSEITSQNKLASDLIDDSNSGNKFVTTSEKQTWNNKYDKPNGGIPKTDLASAVQTSLGKADTAIQSHQDISGKANKISVVQTSASTIEINPNTFYKFGEVASLNITLASITDNTIYNEYMFEFVSGTTATTLTLPSSIKWLETPTIDANKIYQCSIVDNVGLLVGVANV